MIRFVFFFREAQKKENDVARTSTINRVELRKKESKEATSSEAEKDRRRRKNQGGWSAATLDLQMTSMTTAHPPTLFYLPISLHAYV